MRVIFFTVFICAGPIFPEQAAGRVSVSAPRGAGGARADGNMCEEWHLRRGARPAGGIISSIIFFYTNDCVLNHRYSDSARFRGYAVLCSEPSDDLLHVTHTL